MGGEKGEGSGGEVRVLLEGKMQPHLFLIGAKNINFINICNELQS
jgi:hypothetical protein